MSNDEEKNSIANSWFWSLCCRVLKAGHIPKHAAFIMDGNRRFAKKMQYERQQGHVLGFEKLAEVSEYEVTLCIVDDSLYKYLYSV